LVRPIFVSMVRDMDTWHGTDGKNFEGEHGRRL
jgi:hypothetical protein